MKGNIPVRIEPFQLERWMTKYEVNVKWDIAESGIYPMSVREILNCCHPKNARPNWTDCSICGWDTAKRAAARSCVV